MELHGFKLSKLSALLVLFLMLLLPSGCNENNPDNTGAQSPDAGPAADAKTASAAVKILWHDTASQQPDANIVKAAPLDCNAASVENVIIKVYDETNSHLVTAGPLPCTENRGTVDRIPIGENRRFVVLAADAAGDIRFNGQTGGVTINPGVSTPEPVVVEAYRFISALTAPDNETQVDSNTASLSWSQVDNADEYQVQIAEDAEFQNEIVNESTPALEFAPTNLEPGKTYYWKISAMDAYKNMGTASETRIFTTIDMPMISGTVLTANDDAITGVTITFETADGGTATVTTDDSGTYRRAVPEGWTGIVTPSSDRYRFEPGFENFTNVMEDFEQNFTGTAVTPTISGQIVQASNQNRGIGDITIEFTNGGGNATTSDDGSYSIAVPFNWTGTATPVSDQYSFNPASRPYTTDVTADMTNQNYTGASNTRTISGRVVQRDNPQQGMEGVTVSCQGVAGSEYTTAEDGNYVVTVSYETVCTIIARRDFYHITPTSRNLGSITENIQGPTFTAGLFRPSISGRVIAESNQNMGVPNVRITFDDVGSVTTADDGTYSITVPYEWNGSATAAAQGYEYRDASIVFDRVTSQQVNQNFIVTGVEISGSITDGTGAPIQPAVTVDFGDNRSTTTNPNNGTYSIYVPYNWNGTATPVPANGYTFEPTSRTIPNVLSRFEIPDFIGTRPTNPTISGVVTDVQGAPLSGVTVRASNNGGSDVTANDGTYSIAVPYNWFGLLTATLNGYTFESHTYTDNEPVREDQPGTNFTGTIRDNIPILTVTAFPATINEGQGTSPGNTAVYQIERSGNMDLELNISVAWEGTATENNDYTLDPPYTDFILPRGEPFYEITLTTTDDGDGEPDETVILTIRESLEFVIPPTGGSATVTIEDDD